MMLSGRKWKKCLDKAGSGRYNFNCIALKRGTQRSHREAAR